MRQEHITNWRNSNYIRICLHWWQRKGTCSLSMLS